MEKGGWTNLDPFIIRPRYPAQYLTIVWRIRRVDRANIVRNSNGAFKQQPWPAATRRLRQQLPRQRYLTYNICLNHDVVRLHKPVPEPEHGALYSSQAAADGCVRAPVYAHIFANTGVCTLVPVQRVPFTAIGKNSSRSDPRSRLPRDAGEFFVLGGKERSGSRFSVQRRIERCTVQELDKIFDIFVDIFVYFILHGISYLEIDAMVDDGTFEEENSFDRNKFIEIVNFYVTSKFTRFVCKDGLNSSAAALFLPRHTYWL